MAGNWIQNRFQKIRKERNNMENQNNSRRSFIRKAVVGGVAAFTIPEILSASMGEAEIKRVQLSRNNVVLFQGDSITDAGRNKEDQGYNTSKILGTGYAFLAAANLLNKYASFDLKIYNRGISGNKVYQLAERCCEPSRSARHAGDGRW